VRASLKSVCNCGGFDQLQDQAADALEQIPAALLAGIAPGVVLMDAGYGNKCIPTLSRGCSLSHVAAIHLSPCCSADMNDDSGRKIATGGAPAHRNEKVRFNDL
jgi:hypothetical protein